MDFKPARSAGGVIGFAMLVAVGGLWVGLAYAARAIGSGPVAALIVLAAVLVLPLVAWLTYWLWGYLSLKYSVSRDGLEIRWAASRQIVPMAAITHILTGRPYARGLSGFRWPGHEVGRAACETDEGRLTETLVYATTPPEGQLLVVTPHLAYAISPANPAQFVDELKLRRAMGPVQQIDQETRQPRWARLDLWRDWTALRFLALAGLLNAIAFAVVIWRYPVLPEEVAMQFRYDPELAIAVPGAPRDLSYIWTLPGIGLAVAVGNGILGAIVHSKVRMATVILAVAAVLTQIALLIVIVRLGA